AVEAELGADQERGAGAAERIEHGPAGVSARRDQLAHQVQGVGRGQAQPAIAGGAQVAALRVAEARAGRWELGRGDHGSWGAALVPQVATGALLGRPMRVMSSTVAVAPRA